MDKRKKTLTWIWAHP